MAKPPGRQLRVELSPKERQYAALPRTARRSCVVDLCCVDVWWDDNVKLRSVAHRHQILMHTHQRQERRVAQRRRDTMELFVPPPILQPTRGLPRPVHKARPLIAQRHKHVVSAAMSVPEWEPVFATSFRIYQGISKS